MVLGGSRGDTRWYWYLENHPLSHANCSTACNVTTLVSFHSMRTCPHKVCAFIFFPQSPSCTSSLDPLSSPFPSLPSLPLFFPTSLFSSLLPLPSLRSPNGKICIQACYHQLPGTPILVDFPQNGAGVLVTVQVGECSLPSSQGRLYLHNAHIQLNSMGTRRRKALYV